MSIIKCPQTGRFLLQLGMYISDKGYWRYSGGEHRGKYVHRHLMEIAVGRSLRKDEMGEREHNAVSAKQFWFLSMFVWPLEKKQWDEYHANVLAEAK